MVSAMNGVSFSSMPWHSRRASSQMPSGMVASSTKCTRDSSALSASSSSSSDNSVAARMRSLCLNNSTNKKRGQEKSSSFSVNRISRMRDRELTSAAKRMLVSTMTGRFIFSRHLMKRDSLRDHQSDLDRKSVV